MKAKKTPAPRRAGNAECEIEFARLVLELAALNPERLHDFGEEMLAIPSRSHMPNKK